MVTTAGQSVNIGPYGKIFLNYSSLKQLSHLKTNFAGMFFAFFLCFLFLFSVHQLVVLDITAT